VRLRLLFLIDHAASSLFAIRLVFFIHSWVLKFNSKIRPVWPFLYNGFLAISIESRMSKIDEANREINPWIFILATL
jgi:hypothetical protein